MVMGGGLCFKGREFESRLHILDGHFFTYVFVVKFVMCLDRRKKMKKRPGLAHFFKKQIMRKSDLSFNK